MNEQVIELTLEDQRHGKRQAVGTWDITGTIAPILIFVRGGLHGFGARYLFSQSAHNHGGSGLEPLRYLTMHQTRLNNLKDSINYTGDRKGVIAAIGGHIFKPCDSCQCDVLDNGSYSR